MTIHAPASVVDAVVVRPIEPVDANALLRFHSRLSNETTYFRFFRVHPELTAAELHEFTCVDHQCREAIVATADGEILGVARLDMQPGTHDAEVAFVVEDRWQGHGLGHLLFWHLVARARALGIGRFTAQMLQGNRRMLQLFVDTGLVVSTNVDDGIIDVVMDLELATPTRIFEETWR